MSKAVFSQRDAQPLDQVMDQLRNRVDINGVMAAEDEIGIGPVPPEVATFFFGLTQTPTGQQVLEFLCDVAIRRHRGAVPATLEAKAMTQVAREEGEFLIAMIAAAAEQGRLMSEQENNKKKKEN